jgi:uncharacterized membrane protein
MTVDSRQIVDDYLVALEEELLGLSPSDRAEIILEVREHYEEARRELVDPTEADLRNIVERLGPPAEIAAEARQRLGVAIPTTESGSPSVPPPSSTPTSAAGPLEIATLILWVLWWPLGVILMALSPRWTRREKATALVVELGFFAVLLGASLTPIYFTGARGYLSHIFIYPVFLLFPPTLAGLFGAGYLTWKIASRGKDREWSTPWKVAGRTAGILVGAWLLWALVLGPLTLLVMEVRGRG